MLDLCHSVYHHNHHRWHLNQLVIYRPQFNASKTISIIVFIETPSNPSSIKLLQSLSCSSQISGAEGYVFASVSSQSVPFTTNPVVNYMILLLSQDFQTHHRLYQHKYRQNIFIDLLITIVIYSITNFWAFGVDLKIVIITVFIIEISIAIGIYQNISFTGWFCNRNLLASPQPSKRQRQAPENIAQSYKILDGIHRKIKSYS